MRNHASGALWLLALAGCASMTGGGDERYRAVGTEPFWTITLGGRRMAYASLEGGFSVAAPRGEETGDGREMNGCGGTRSGDSDDPGATP